MEVILERRKQKAVHEWTALCLSIFGCNLFNSSYLFVLASTGKQLSAANRAALYITSGMMIVTNHGSTIRTSGTRSISEIPIFRIANLDGFIFLPVMNDRHSLATVCFEHVLPAIFAFCHFVFLLFLLVFF